VAAASRRSTARSTAAPTRRCCGCCGGSTASTTSPTSRPGEGPRGETHGLRPRVYKNYDPRARIIQGYLDPIFEATEYNPLVEIARELEKHALADDYFTERKLYPNVDFYSGSSTRRWGFRPTCSR